MAFSQFSYPEAVARFGLTREASPDLFAGVPAVAPGPLLVAAQPVSNKLGAMAHSETARAIWLVGPLLADFWSRYAGRINLLAGVEFAADPEAGLTGFVDFLICRSPQTHFVTPPALVMFEAKRDSIPDGLGQCVAAMVGGQRFNRRAGEPDGPVYGCVTTGSVWKFLRLDGVALVEDMADYGPSDAARLLGILTHIVGPPPG